MCSVVLWQHEEPTKTIQIAVVRVSGGGLRIGLGRELRNETSARRHGLFGQILYARPRDRGRSRAGLSGGAGLGSGRQAQSDEGYTPLDDQKVSRHLTEPPVVVRAPGEVGVRRPGDPSEEPVPLGGGPRGEDSDRLPKPFGAVRRVIDDP